MIHLFLFAWLAGQAATSDAQQHMQAGLEARKQHQVDLEITEFRKATESDSNLADAFVNLGAAYMEKHDYGAAIPPLKRALEMSPDLPVAHQLIGYALLSQGYSAEAIPHLQRVGALDALGIAQIETNQLTEAVTSFTAALAQHPGDPDLLYYLGHASGLLSKDAIDNLLATHPDSARAHQALAEKLLCSSPDAASREGIPGSAAPSARPAGIASGARPGLCKLRAMVKSGSGVSCGIQTSPGKRRSRLPAGGRADAAGQGA